MDSVHLIHENNITLIFSSFKISFMNWVDSCFSSDPYSYLIPNTLQERKMAMLLSNRAWIYCVKKYVVPEKHALLASSIVGCSGRSEFSEQMAGVTVEYWVGQRRWSSRLQRASNPVKKRGHTHIRRKRFLPWMQCLIGGLLQSVFIVTTIICSFVAKCCHPKFSDLPLLTKHDQRAWLHKSEISICNYRAEEKQSRPVSSSNQYAKAPPTLTHLTRTRLQQWQHQPPPAPHESQCPSVLPCYAGPTRL